MTTGAPWAAGGGGFASFFQAGFESASQRRRDGVRLDLLRATAHDRHALADYRRCRALGLDTIRDGVRWHRIETRTGSFDWATWQPMLEAAEIAQVQVVWTLLHYGIPDHLDLRSEAFIESFARYAAEAARIHRSVTGRPALFCPINEISFFAWAAGKGYFRLPGAPSAAEVKRQLVRAALAGVRAVRAVDTECRFLWSEPLVHVAARNHERDEQRRAEAYRLAQYEALDMLTGRAAAELGGAPDVADWIGLNFYPHNQWYYEGSMIPLGHHAFRPLADMLVEAGERYSRPMLLAETGAEGGARPAWLHYVCDEVRRAGRSGAIVDAICIYPVTHYSGWDDSRKVMTGLFSEADGRGDRHVDPAIAGELDRQQHLFAAETRVDEIRRRPDFGNPPLDRRVGCTPSS